jgi:glycosyltransferase involved in cell wall biosynthesis
MLTFFEKCFLTPFALLCGYKVIWAHHAPFGNWFFKNPLLFLWKLWSRKVSIIVPSRAMKQECMNVWKNDSSSQAKCHHIFVVHNALPFFPSSSLEKRKEILSQIPFPSEPIIGTASRLSLGKNIFDFLDIAENLSKQNILIAGDGPEKEKLLQEIRSRNIRNVILLGHTERKDLSSFYKVLHIYCSCSTYETFGLSLLEAAHFGVPVVAPDVGGISEVVKNKCTGLLYERRNMLDARKKILELIKSPQMHKRMKEKSVEHAKKFSVGRFIHSMTTILFSA